MEYRQISLDTNLFTTGALLGTSGTSQLIKQINDQSGFNSNYYGTSNDLFGTTYRNFMSGVIQPARQAQVMLQQAQMAVNLPDVSRPLDSVAEFEKGVPPCMYDGILMYPPIRKLAEDNRIEAFGIDVMTYPVEDSYGRLINNGTVVLTADKFQDDGTVEFVWEWKSTDPDITQEALDDLEVTRLYLEQFLNSDDTHHLDPTSLPFGELRG